MTEIIYENYRTLYGDTILWMCQNKEFVSGKNRSISFCLICEAMDRVQVEWKQVFPSG